jgi:hypothetical protein
MPVIFPVITAVKLPMVLLPRSLTKDRQRPGCVLAQQNRAASHLFADKLSRELKQRGDSSRPQGPLEGALHHTAPIRARTRVHAHLTHSPTCPPTMGLSRGAVSRSLEYLSPRRTLPSAHRRSGAPPRLRRCRARGSGTSPPSRRGSVGASTDAAVREAVVSGCVIGASTEAARALCRRREWVCDRRVVVCPTTPRVASALRRLG